MTELQIIEHVTKYVRNLVIGMDTMPNHEQIQTWVRTELKEEVTLAQIRSWGIPSKKQIQIMFLEVMRVV